jgi:DNA-binding MarR family transcriptional regulator
VSDDTPWLTSGQLDTWMHLAGVIMTLPPALDAQLKRNAGLNLYEYSILVGLAQAPDRSRQLCELAQVAYGSQSRLSHAISRMEKQGWVARRDVGGAHRVAAVLTDAGYAKLVEAAPGHVREVRRLVIDVLTPEQLGQLGSISRSLLGASSPQAPALLDVALTAHVAGMTVAEEDPTAAARDLAAAEGELTAVPGDLAACAGDVTAPDDLAGCAANVTAAGDPAAAGDLAARAAV